MPTAGKEFVIRSFFDRVHHKEAALARSTSGLGMVLDEALYPVAPGSRIVVAACVFVFAVVYDVVIARTSIYDRGVFLLRSKDFIVWLSSILALLVDCLGVRLLLYSFVSSFVSWIRRLMWRINLTYETRTWLSVSPDFCRCKEV